MNTSRHRFVPATDRGVWFWRCVDCGLRQDTNPIYEQLLDDLVLAALLDIRPRKL